MKGSKSALELSISLMIFLILLIPFCVFTTSAETVKSTVESDLADADASIASAYQEVLKAEEAGANVTSLLLQLSDSGRLLAQAQVAYRLKYFNNASNLAALSKNISEDVKGTAIKLKASTRSEWLRRMLLTTTVSIVSIALIALGSLWVWRALEKRFDGIDSEN